MSNFTKIFSTKATDVTPVHKYKSEATGLTVVIAEVEGPIVSAFICLATEAHDDDGLPHTLEHLIFLGSEIYPYKGLLDLLANRCLASGTNAWTDVDHTAYSLHTAGASGALALLPVYLDHILSPLLTDFAFLTEVHHVSQQGLDAGVVYCEMQGRENSAESRCYNRLQQMLYPDSGFSSETGGKLHNLRTSTTNEKVKEYHKKFYRPENITLIIAGQIEPEDVFKALQSVEDKVVSKGERPPFERPWQGSVPGCGPTVVERLPYPADQEDCGLVLLGWRGPDLLQPGGISTFTALSVLLRYLCDTPAAPLQKVLTEVEHPYASNVVHNMVENSASMMCVMLENVEMSRLNLALPVVLEELQRVGSGKEPLELERLHRLLRLQHREALAHTETNPHQTITFMCIADMLHSNDEKQMEERLNKQRILRKLEEKDVEWWRSLCQEWLCGDHKAVIGVPSTDLMEKMAQEEELRVQEQIKKLGPKGLQEKEQLLNKAMEHNGREVPAEVLTSMGVAQCDGIRFHTLETWASGGAPCPYFPLQDMPFYTRIHHVPSLFVYISVLIDTSSLTTKEAKWLPLLLAVLMESPVRRNGELLPHTTLVSDIEDLTNDIKLDLGIRKAKRFSPGEFGQFAIFSTQCEPERYSRVVTLLWEVLMATELVKERLVVVAQRMVQEVATLRRDGERLVVDLLRDLNYSDKSNIYSCSMLRQQSFLRAVLQRLEGEGAPGVVLKLQRVLARLLTPGNLWVQLAANLQAQPLTAEPWLKFATTPATCVRRGDVKTDSCLLRPADQRLGKGCIVGVGGLESCFLEQTSPGPLGLQHPELPALLVALQYFTQLEGPMWRLVRGAGLAYGFLVLPLPGEGLLRLMLYKATNPTEAYQQTIKIFKTFLESAGEWDENLFACAKSSLVFEIVEREKTPSKLVKESLNKYLHQVDDGYMRQLVCSVCAVTEQEARKAAERWLPALYAPAQSTVSIVCHPTRVQEIATQFTQMGHNLSTCSSPEESRLNDWESKDWSWSDESESNDSR